MIRNPGCGVNAGAKLDEPPWDANAEDFASDVLAAQ
jgi:hypothetical protein